MTKEINEAGKELVVDSIRILKGDGFNGAGAATIERRINQVEQSVQVLSGRQNDFWSEIGKDNVITPIEKQTLYKEREVIRTEYASITKRAEDMGITGNLVYQKYDSAYNLLNNMLTNYGVFDDMSDSTTIPNRELFNLSYSEYYDMRDALQDAITKGYVSEGQGTLDRDAVPSMKLSAYAVRVNDSLTVYDPPRIEITGVITNGTYEDPYNSIFEIYRNGSETPSVRTGILKTLSYDIPQGTVDLRIVQRNVEGRLIYDDEVIHILNAESGSKMVLDNAYQTFINGTKTKADTEQTDLKTVVKAYSNGYERPVENVTVSEAPSLQVILDDNNTIHMVPTDEVLESGEIEVSATMRDPQVVGFGGFVLGDPNTGFVIGQIIREPVEEKIEYKNYDTLAFQELESKQLEDATKGKYLGPVSQPQTLQNVEYGQYFLYTGDDTAYWQKGTLYLWNGKRWVLDFNNEHNTVAMKDMFSLLDSMPALANEFIHNLIASRAFIQYIFTEVLTIKKNGGLVSEDYVEGLSGFCLKNVIVDQEKGTTKGYLEVTDGIFRGELRGASGDFTGSITLPSGKALKFNSGSTIQNIKVDGTTLTLVVS